MSLRSLARRPWQLLRRALALPSSSHGSLRSLRDAVLGKGVRIQVGAGGTALDGWINTDINGPADYLLDATQRWPLPDGSVTHIYGDNFVEHLTLSQTRAFLTHALRALVPEGRIRLVTPDVESAARLYLAGGGEALALAARHRKHGYQMEYPQDLLRVVFAESQHWLGYCFDEASLRTELERAGFVDVRRCHVGESEDPILRGLETRSEPIDDVMQLVLEASRPSDEARRVADHG